MSDSRLVYSTSGNDRCPRCHKSLRKCHCAIASERTPAIQGKIVISRETKGRKGKAVTRISGLALPETELKVLAKQLKTLCGSGGAIKAGVIEIQGDQRDTIKQLLKKQFPQSGL